MNFLEISSQEIILEITSKNELENKVLKKISYIKKHKDSNSIIKEAQSISSYLKNIGYFTNSIDSIKNNKNRFKVYFSLNSKVKTAFIQINIKIDYPFKTQKNKDNTIIIPIESLQKTLINISENLDNNGKSFSKVQLKNITIRNDSLFAEVKINESEKRKIDKIIIKGYENFPRSFLKNYFLLNNESIFNQKKVKEISSLTKSLQFVKEIKPPEILFTKDSTLLYMYIKKQQNSSFDGILNFTTKENGGLLLNGNIDLSLNNTLNSGENLKLFWNSIGEERQEFKVSTEIPYIFNSKISPEISFSLYKQDSSFFNTKLNSKFYYNINTKSKVALTYNSISSKNLQKKTDDNIKTFNSYFFGLQFEYRISKNDPFFNDKFYLAINPTIGKRKTELNSSNQFKIKTWLSYIWDLNLRSSVFIKNESGILNSKSSLKNELFRVGGNNSLRGFINQSIFTNKYTYFNIEYRYLSSKKSYLYTISDAGFINTFLEKKEISSIGLGFNFIFNNIQVNLSSIATNNSIKDINFKKPSSIISFKALF